MKFANYQAFKHYIWNEYVPLPEEVTNPEEGFAPETNWARRHAPRFYRGLTAIQGHMRPGAALLDIGTYPGSFPRLARACFSDEVKVSACGMPGTSSFHDALSRAGIAFRACNIDPQVVTTVEIPAGISNDQIPKGLPFDPGSIDVITCMEVVEHLYSLKTLFTECHRVLVPGGILYLTTNNIMDRVGLLRIFRSHDTNLDDDLDQTTVWSDANSPWRGHVRFYSIKQLAAAGARAGLASLRTGFFQQHEDPDVIVWPDGGRLATVRRRLRGRGDTPPVNLRLMAQCLIHLGPRAFSHCYDTHLEITFMKARQEPSTGM